MRRPAAALALSALALTVAVVSAEPAAAAPPTTTTTPGFDISTGTAADIDNAVSLGAKFVFIKALETDSILGNLSNSSYQTLTNEAAAQKLPHAAYVVADQGDGKGHITNAATDAQAFVDAAAASTKGQPYTLAPVIDLEQGKTTTCWITTNANWNSTHQTQMVNWLKTYIATVQKGFGRAPIIYTNQNWWNTCTGNSTAFSSYPLWIASYGDSGSTPKMPSGGWSRYTFWQWSDNVNDGSKFPGDQDVFVGNQSALNALLAPIPAAPTPTISGTAKAGYTMTASAGSWTQGTTLSYQWYQNGSVMVGQTSPTLSVGYGQVGKTITVRVTGALAGFSGVTKTSAATASVAPGTLTAPTPTISGTAKAGYVLTANAGTWTAGTALQYRWYQNGALMAGQTGKTVSIGYGQVGKKIQVRVTGTKAGYTTVVKTSAATAAVAQGTLKVGKPTVSGTLKVGSTLTVNPGSWTAGTTFRYQWYSGSTYIGAGSGTHFTLPAAEKGKTVFVRVIGSKVGYADAGALSATTAKVQ